MVVTDNPPLGPDTEAAVLAAAREVLVQGGYRGFDVEAVAIRAGVDRAAIDRRWTAVDRLLADVLGEACAIRDIPDRGHSRGELSTALFQLIGSYSDRPRFEPALLALAADCADDPASVGYLRQRYELGRAPVVEALRRAVARGDLPPDVDTDLIVDTWAGAIAHRRVLGGGALDGNLVEALLDLVLPGLAPLRGPQPPTGPPPYDPWPWWLEAATDWLDGVVFGRVCPTTDSVPVRALAAVPERTAAVAGHPVTVSVQLGRDFMPTTTPDGDRLGAGVTVDAVGGGTLPPFLRADRVAVLHGDEVWVAPLAEEDPRRRTSRRFEASARQGPRWEPGTTVDVVVRLVAEQGVLQLVRVSGQRIGKVY